MTLDISNKTRCVDDSLLWEETIREHFWATCRYIDLCARNGVIFTPKKFQFAKDTDFAGFTITKNSIKPTTTMIASIAEFPIPTTLTGARAWFGLVNEVAYALAQSAVMAPFRELLKKNKKFYWDAALDEL